LTRNLSFKFQINQNSLTTRTTSSEAILVELRGSLLDGWHFCQWEFQLFC